MTKTEVAGLLTIIAAFDRRTLGESDVEAWHLILDDLNSDDCAAAVKHHFATSRDWLMPADVRAFAINAARRREGQQRQAQLDAALAAENPPTELRSRPVQALTVGRSVPVDDDGRAERRQMLRQAAHSRRAAVSEQNRAAADHRARIAAALAELHPEAHT